MEVLVLLGGFAAVFVCGYVLMSKLDDWLAAPQNKEEHPGAGTHVRVATSRLDFVPVVSAALKELSSQHPDLHCTCLLYTSRYLLICLYRFFIPIIHIPSKGDVNDLMHILR